MVTLVGICLGGLEEQVIQDIARLAPSSAVIRQFSRSKVTTSAIEVEGKLIDRGECGCGKVLISNIQDYQFIHNVRSVQHWLVYLAESTTVPCKKIEGINHIQGIVPSDTVLEDAVTGWKKCLSETASAKYQELLSGARQAKFCVRAIRDGEHEYTSLDIACKIGESVLSKTKWTVDLCNMDFEIIALVLSETMLIGINIPTTSPAFLKARLPGEVRPPVVPSGLTSSMRPSTAYLLVQMAKPQMGDILVDAMCGGGAAFVEAAYSHGCVAFGGDVDTDLRPTLLQSVQQVNDMSKNRAVAEVAWWGAPKLPFLDGSVDIVILDLPFGKTSKKVPRYYAKQRVPRHVTELARLLRPGMGRVVLLVQSHQHLAACLDSVYFRHIKVTGVNIGGYICSVVTADRTERVFVPSFNTPIEDKIEESTIGVKRSAADGTEP